MRLHPNDAKPAADLLVTCSRDDQRNHLAEGIDRIVPADVCVTGCPPRPEAVLFGTMMLQHLAKDRRYRAIGPTVIDGI